MAPQVKPFAPSQGGNGSGQDKPARLWRVLLPLVLLLIPLGLYIASLYLPPNWRYWIDLTAWVLTGAIVVWVLIRLVLYLRTRILQRRQKAFVRRQDPLFVTAAKIEGRIRQVMARLKAAGLAGRKLPWLALLAHDPEDAGAVLAASGLTFPQGMSDGLNLDDDQPDVWHLANQAVMVETCGVGPAAERKRRLLFGRLASVRSAEPFSAAVLLLKVDQLADMEDEEGQVLATGLLEAMRGMQESTSLNFPVYLLVSGLKRLPGFYEFFEALDGESRQQILGWSEPQGPESEFDKSRFRIGINDMRRQLRGFMLRRLQGNLPPLASGKAYMFAQEMDSLLGRVGRVVETVFAPNRYLDPLPLRGVYFLGSGAEGPPISFTGAGALSSPGFDETGGGMGPEQDQWLTADVFNSKILAEPDLTSRPWHALRHNYFVKAACGVLLAGVLGLAAWQVQDTVRTAARVQAQAGALLREAQLTLAGDKPTATPLILAARLSAAADELDQVRWGRRVIGAGRFVALRAQIGQVHRAVFQELFLRGQLDLVREALRDWAGEGSFKAFTEALAEYIRWANPARGDYGHLRFAPFADFIGSGERLRELRISQFQRYLQEGGPNTRLIGADQQLVLRALDKVQSYLNPSLPSGAGAQGNVNESQWWLEFSLGLGKLSRSYDNLLLTKPPDDQAPFEEAAAYYDTMVDSLADLLNQADNVHQMILEAAQQNAGWVGSQRTFRLLSQAALGWEGVEKRVAGVRDAGRIYLRRIISPLKRKLYLVQMFYGRPGFGWLDEVLTGALGKQVELVLDPSRQVGPFVLDLYKALGDYHSRIETWANGYQTWKVHISGFSSIGQPARILRMDERNLGKARDRVQQVQLEIKGLAGQKKKTPTAQAAAPKALGKMLHRKQDNAGLDEMLGDYRWGQLNQMVNQWLGMFKRISLYHTSLYWRELAAKFTYAKDLQAGQTWAEMKREPAFSLGDGEALTSPVGDFLRDWQRELPQDLLSLSSPSRKSPPPPEQRDFVDLNQHLSNFQQKYLPSMRKAALNFVRCVHDMDLDPGRAWTQIWRTSGPGASGTTTVSWGALASLSTFRDSFEASQGPVLDNLTEPLVAVQRAVVDSFQSALLKDFEQRWNSLIKKYQDKGFAGSFPFFSQGGSEVSRQDLLAFFSELEGLAKAYALLPGNKPQQAAVKLYPNAQRILSRLTAGGRLQFVESCLSLASFVEDRNLKTPRSVKARIIPGEIGRHVHWVRLDLGNGSFYDLNVYGKPVLTIPMHAGVASVTFEGLDVAQNPLSSKLATKGDFALLQLPYSLGASKDPQRKRWLIQGQLPSVDEPGRMIPFQIELVFNQSLPQLPQWPMKAR